MESKESVTHLSAWPASSQIPLRRSSNRTGRKVKNRGSQDGIGEPAEPNRWPELLGSASICRGFPSVPECTYIRTTGTTRPPGHQTPVEFEN